MAKLPLESDAELLDRYCRGEQDAFRELVSRYKNGLYAFLSRFLSRQDLVEEVFQETFLQLSKSKDSFDRSRPLRPWLFTIAANKARDALRKQQRANTTSLGAIAAPTDLSVDDVVNSFISYEITPYDETEKAETSQMVRQIVDEMPANLKEILILAYFKQFSYKQMAEILSIPIGTVKSRLHTAVVHFTKKWKLTSGGENI